jgi:hypothetical protein
MKISTFATLTALLAFPAIASEKPGQTPNGRPDQSVASIAGVYKYRFTNGTVAGEEYQSEDILEIVELSPDTAYFRAELEFFNGHSCSIYGMAHWLDRVLHYEEADETGRCALRIVVNDKELSFVDDPDAPCRDTHCGMRGGFDGKRFERSGRRAIRYMQRLLDSREFAEARSAYEATGKRLSLPPSSGDDGSKTEP